MTDHLLSAPVQLAERMLWISDRAAFDKVHLMAESGAGKSRWLGRIWSWQLFSRGWPQLMLDPTGVAIDNLLDKVMWLSDEDQVQLWPRVRYVDMSGKGSHVVPFPLYYRLHPNESLFDVSQRYVEVIRQMDPDLMKAPVLGFNALYTIGTYTGMLLTALGLQITEAESLLRHPKTWDGRFERALSISDELLPAVEFFRKYSKLGPADQNRISSAFLTKILPFKSDPAMRAMFGTSETGIDLDEVVNKHLTVCFDFSRELNPTHRRFKLKWVFRLLSDYFKLRGVAGRQQPIGFNIDELTQLLGFGATEHSAMAEDIEELVSVVARNYGVAPLVISHQNLPQINSERIQKALMTMGTQMIGVQTDPESAMFLAQYFHRYDAYKIKRAEPVWMSGIMGSAYVVDYRPVEFTIEEQGLLHSYDFMDLAPFEFLVRPAPGEGNKLGELASAYIGNFDAGIYPSVYWCNKAREELIERDGRQVDEIISEIEARQLLKLGVVRSGGGKEGSQSDDAEPAVRLRVPVDISTDVDEDSPPWTH